MLLEVGRDLQFCTTLRSWFVPACNPWHLHGSGAQPVGHPSLILEKGLRRRL